MKSQLGHQCRKLVLAVTILSVASLFTACSTIWGMVISITEDPSLELSMDRVDAIHRGSTHAEALLRETRLGESDWPAGLYDIQKQAQGIAKQVTRRGPHNQTPAVWGLIRHRSYYITNARIFADFVGAQRDKIGKGAGPYESVLHAFGIIYGEKGQPVLEGLQTIATVTDALKKAQDALAQTEAELEEEEEREEVAEDVITALEEQIELSEEEVETKEERLEIAEEKVVALITACEGAPISAEHNDIAWDVLHVVNFMAYLYEANLEAAGMILVQVPRAFPGIMDELKDLGVRTLVEMFTDMTQESMSGLYLGLTVGDDGLELELVGAPKGMNTTDVKRQLADHLGEVFVKAGRLPGQIGSIGTDSGSRYRLLAAMVKALEASTGREIGPLTGMM